VRGYARPPTGIDSARSCISSLLLAFGLGGAAVVAGDKACASAASASGEVSGIAAHYVLQPGQGNCSYAPRQAASRGHSAGPTRRLERARGERRRLDRVLADLAGQRARRDASNSPWAPSTSAPTARRRASPCARGPCPRTARARAGRRLPPRRRSAQARGGRASPPGHARTTPAARPRRRAARRWRTAARPLAVRREQRPRTPRDGLPPGRGALRVGDIRIGERDLLARHRHGPDRERVSVCPAAHAHFGYAPVTCSRGRLALRKRSSASNAITKPAMPNWMARSARLNEPFSAPR
jgi:hypothetical protein